MDLLCGSEQKLCDLEEEMNFLDNDMFQPTPALVRRISMEPYGKILCDIFFSSCCVMRIRLPFFFLYMNL